MNAKTLIIFAHLLVGICQKSGIWYSESLHKIIFLFWKANVPLAHSHLNETVISTCQFKLLVDGSQLKAEELKFISFLTPDIVPFSFPHYSHLSCIILYFIDCVLHIHSFLQQKFNIQCLKT